MAHIIIYLVFGFLSLFAAFATLCNLRKLAPDEGGQSGRAGRPCQSGYGVDHNGNKYETWGR